MAFLEYRFKTTEADIFSLYERELLRTKRRNQRIAQVALAFALGTVVGIGLACHAAGYLP